MSYTDQQGRRSPASIAAVVAVHVAIGYAFISGLAIRVIRDPNVITTAQFFDEPVPPPEHALPPPPVKMPSKVATTVDPIVRVPLSDAGPTIAPVKPAFDIPLGGGGTTETVTAEPPQRQSLARALVALGSRGAWVTEADYPPAALRAGIEGTTEIVVTVGADGRVTGCEVTRSSGDAGLDQATCRVYARRARFQPALDDNGQPTIARRTDRVRWQLPAD